MPDSITHEAIVNWVRGFAGEIAESRSYLTELDLAIGDGDHGSNMDRGMRKVVERLDDLGGDDIGVTLKAVGMALVSSVGGAAGPLYGTLFMQMGSAVSGRSELDLAGWGTALDAAVAGVRARGKAEPGDKTMVDALMPALEGISAAEAEGAGIGEALRRSAAAAEEGMKATVEMVARKGRASYLGERSAGHQDPGATSSYLLLRSAADALSGEARREARILRGQRR